MGKKIAFVKVGERFKNPLILAKKLNPIRSYRAIVFEDGKIREHLTGVIFGNQKVKDQVKHHALVRGLGEVTVKIGRKKKR